MNLWEHPTLNIQHPTSNERPKVRHWMFDVESWLLDVCFRFKTATGSSTARRTILPLPKGEGRGEGEWDNQMMTTFFHDNDSAKLCSVPGFI